MSFYLWEKIGTKQMRYVKIAVLICVCKIFLRFCEATFNHLWLLRDRTKKRTQWVDKIRMSSDIDGGCLDDLIMPSSRLPCICLGSGPNFEPAIFWTMTDSEKKT